MKFYDLELDRELPLLSPSIGSIECWRARDRGQPVTIVRSREDIIAHHLKGELYFSNIEAFEADLRAIISEGDELVLREVRRYERGAIPVAIFEPLDGWALRELVTFVRCDVEIAAALTLAIYRIYQGGPNVLTRDGQIIHRLLPSFENIWEREMPSLIGIEPEISLRGRVDESCAFMEQLSDFAPTRDIDAFCAELEALAHPDVGPALLRLLDA